MSEQRDARLDGLRGLAALLVGAQLCLEFLIFGEWASAAETLPRVLVYDFDLRVMGAGLFWLLAGYWVGKSAVGPRAFVLRKALRLYPAFLAAFVAAFALAAVLRLAPTLHALPRMLALLHVPIADPTFASVHGVVSVVLVFYALSLLPCTLGWGCSPHWPGGAIILLFALLAAMIVVGRSWHLHVPIRFALGLALTHFGAWMAVRRQDGWLKPLLFLLATLLVCRLGWSTAWGAGELWIGQAIGFGGAILLFLGTLGSGRIWFGWLAPLGLITYELWLVFPPLLAASRFMVDYARIDMRLIAIAASVALAVPFAWLLRRFVTQLARARG